MFLPGRLPASDELTGLLTGNKETTDLERSGIEVRSVDGGAGSAPPGPRTRRVNPPESPREVDKAATPVPGGITGVLQMVPICRFDVC